MIEDETDFIDITPHYQTSQLKDLLKILDENDYWAKLGPFFVDCTVAAFIDEVMVPGTESDVQQLPCPVEPVKIEHIGTIAALSELGEVDPPLNYVKDGPTYGRILSKPINGKYYFVLGSLLETDPGNRGFDCTTYVGSALGRHDGMGDGSAAFANSMGATNEVLTDVHLSKVREFMEKYPIGAYLMWSTGHIVTLINGTVREFNLPKGKPGYRETDITEWKKNDKSTTFTLRELPAEFL